MCMLCLCVVCVGLSFVCYAIMLEFGFSVFCDLCSDDVRFVCIDICVAFECVCFVALCFLAVYIYI